MVQGEYFSSCVILSAQRRIYFAMSCLTHINDWKASLLVTKNVITSTN